MSIQKRWNATLNISLMVNAQSAMMETPSLSSRAVRNPHTRVSSTSNIEPTYIGEIKHIAPFGVHATKNLTVL